MAKSKAEFFSMGQSDFIGAYKNENRYAIARREFYFERDSWQARAYFDGYQTGGRTYWYALQRFCEQFTAGTPIEQCVNLEQVVAAIESGNAIINHAVQVPYNSQPVIPYAGNKSHTAHNLSLALGERHMSPWISDKWARWDDEARYLAGVIIGSHDATIEG